MKINIDNVDKRVRERYISSGAIKPVDLEKYLDKLPDLEDKCDNLYEEVFGKLEARNRE